MHLACPLGSSGELTAQSRGSSGAGTAACGIVTERWKVIAKSHCFDPTSPYHATGYNLSLRGEWPDAFRE